MASKNAIVITGASGFIGQSLAIELASRGFAVRAIMRSLESPLLMKEGINQLTVGNIGSKTNWFDSLSGASCIVHCAAMNHMMTNVDGNLSSAYHLVNVDGTRRLAEHAVAANVKRLVFLSTVKVNGEKTNKGKPFLISDPVAPQDSYSLSKWRAEQSLLEISAETGLEVVIVRLPVVYGFNPKGNFSRLFNLIRYGIPLPFGAINNLRSLIGLDNLLDFLICCVQHPAAVGQTLFVSDGRDLSTPDILNLMATAMNTSITLLPAPVSLLRIAGSVIKKSSEIERLVESLQVDISGTQKLLGWIPPNTVEDGFRRMVKHI